MVPKLRCRLFGLDIDNLSMGETVAAVERLIQAGRPALVVTPNAQHIVLLRTDKDFRAAYAGADLTVADGLPLVWLSRLVRCPLKERVAGADILPAFASIAARKGYRVAFLGAAPEVAAKAAEILEKKHPGLKVAAAISPPIGFDRDPAACAAVLAAVREARPDVLFVGLGTPKGETWAWRNKAAAGAPVTICVGAAFDFITGIQKRAPLALQQIGLEWLFRLFHDPYRLWKRYTLGNLHFLYLGALEFARYAIGGRRRSRIPKGRD